MENRKLAIPDPQSVPPHLNHHARWKPWLKKMEIFWDENRRGKYFYWPDDEVRKSFDMQRRIKLERITCSWPLASIQLEFSSGIKSKTESNKQAQQYTVTLNNRKRITIVEAKISQGKCWNIILTYDCGETISLNQRFQERHGKEMTSEKRFIPLGNEIIGFFGVMRGDLISSFGFYIWCPNPDAIL